MTVHSRIKITEKLRSSAQKTLEEHGSAYDYYQELVDELLYVVPEEGLVEPEPVEMEPSQFPPSDFGQPEEEETQIQVEPATDQPAPLEQEAPPTDQVEELDEVEPFSDWSTQIPSPDASDDPEPGPRREDLLI